MARLREWLHKEDPIETRQRQNGGININDMGLKYGPGVIPKIPRNNFFNKAFVCATKQHRYSYMPAHTHDFIEFNYQYSGESKQQLSGFKYVLKPGELLVMDETLIQRYGYMDTNDLLVNILINLADLPTNFFSAIRITPSIGRFIYNAQNSNANHDNFMIFDLSNLPQARYVWEELMYYSLTDAKPYQTRGLLLEAGICCLPKPKIMRVHALSNGGGTLNKVLRYIDDHYMDVSLSQVGTQFGYNTNYLGNKIKQETGLSFGDLLNRKRLLTAESLLLDTDLPTGEIAGKLGYHNASSLFRLFSRELQTTPSKFRQDHRGEIN